MAERKPNSLIHEKSPYLLQHAFNPVAWHPWGEEAFSLARSEQKPIFLSVGYSTCHWCHVMEHESFEDEAVASFLNQHFVSIKVDREERPDVDRVYMTALQGMGQDGGWPMSMFLTPALEPFYGGTYFPPRSREGRIGFPDLLDRISKLWETDREKILQTSRAIASALAVPAQGGSASTFDPHLISRCCDQLERTYDPAFGGFGRATKFPRPSVFGPLFRQHARTGSAHLLEMASMTLQKMAEGGIYDHIGGGFHRYSVDRQWRVPHFEKMLYDQAQLVCSYLDVYQITGNPLFVSVARDVLDYVLRDMTHPDGGFFSAEDADSARPEAPGEQGEGAFYLWSKAEILSVLKNDPGELFCFRHGVEHEGNAPFDPQKEFVGKNILFVAHTLEDCAGRFGMTADEAARVLHQCREKLFQVRSKRPRPGLDDKVLTSWNGLMIGALARGYQTTGELRYRDAACRSANFILKALYDLAAGRLRRRFRDGEAKYEGNLDDYAFLSHGLLDLYEATFDAEWIRLALNITKTQMDLFWDSRAGGFFDTSGRDPSIIVRTKEQYDGAEPAGNSIAVMNLLRLAEITGDEHLRQRAHQTLQAFGEMLQKQPVVLPQMVAAFDFSTARRFQIIISSGKDDPSGRKMLEQVHSRYLPNKVVILLDGPENQRRLSEMNGFYSSIRVEEGESTAYVCRDYVCRLPTSDAGILGELLDGKEK